MQIFVNFPVSDLDRSKAFYAALGWEIQPNFTDENAACLKLDDDKYLMLLRREFYATFVKGRKEIGDAHTTSLGIVSFNVESREEVDAFIRKVEAAGGTVGETTDLGFMYQREFEDPDGNHFEPFWMDPVAAENGPPAQ